MSQARVRRKRISRSPGAGPGARTRTAGHSPARRSGGCCPELHSVRGPAVSTPITEAFVAELPKTDLHCHLDGSLRLPTLIELARERPPEDVREAMRLGPREQAQRSWHVRFRGGTPLGLFTTWVPLDIAISAPWKNRVAAIPYALNRVYTLSEPGCRLSGEEIGPID